MSSERICSLLGHYIKLLTFTLFDRIALLNLLSHP